jgi:hypothetical protein
MKEDTPSDKPGNQDAPADEERPLTFPQTNPVQPPPASSGTDQSGWSQPPAPQSPGPPGAFVDRPAAPPGQALPPGRGAPLQPGPPMSVQPPIKDTTINLTAVLLFAAIGIVAIIVIAVIISALAHR